MSAEPASIEDAEARIAVICRFLRAQDAYDIAPYLILRGLRWGQIRYNGPDQIAPQMLEAPPGQIRADLKRYAGEEQWDMVLETTEAAMELPCGRGWLDLQRYAVTALENKGEWFASVAAGVRTALRGLVQDLPQLLDMTLLDDTPTANPETRAWIIEQVLSGEVPVRRPPPPEPEPESEPEAPAPVALPDRPPPMDGDVPAAQPDLFDEALEAARSGKQSEALAMIARQLASERSGRGRFKRRTQLAHLLMTGGNEQVAFPILLQLATEIEERRLEEWEDPEAVAYPLELLLRCNNAEGVDRQRLYSRLCLLDPVRALGTSA